MNKRILPLILIFCMLFLSVQGVFAAESESADMGEIITGKEISAYSDVAEISDQIIADAAVEETELPDETADSVISGEEAGTEIIAIEEKEAEENHSESEEAEETDIEKTAEEEAEEADIEEDLLEASKASVTYRTHVQTYGWQGWKKDGEMSGTQAQSKRLEGIEIKVQGNANLGIRYKTHIQTYGWENGWKTNGQMSGTSGQSKRLEAIRIELTGSDASKYDIWYCVHAQKFGWLNWAKNGADAGTAGYSYRLEGIKIRILPKGSKAPVSEGVQASFYSKSNGPSLNTTTSGVAYNTHVQTYGWQDYVYNGAMAGTKGQSKRLEGIHIALVNPQYSGGIEYRTHIQTYGWESTWRSNGQMSGTSGQAKRLEAIQIRLTGEMANKYDVYYRVHAQHFGWMGWAKNGAQAGTAGYAYRLEAIQIILVKKGGSIPPANVMGQEQNTSNTFTDKNADGVNRKAVWNSFIKNRGYLKDTKNTPTHFFIKDVTGDETPELFLGVRLDGYYTIELVYMMANGNPKLLKYDGWNYYGYSSDYRTIVYDQGPAMDWVMYRFQAYNNGKESSYFEVGSMYNVIDSNHYEYGAGWFDYYRDASGTTYAPKAEKIPLQYYGQYQNKIKIINDSDWQKLG